MFDLLKKVVKGPREMMMQITPLTIRSELRTTPSMEKGGLVGRAKPPMIRIMPAAIKMMTTIKLSTLLRCKTNLDIVANYFCQELNFKCRAK